ncbi:hypothetical protein [Lacihabitans sp. CCS-44]|jgi:hypothetical protein|uniref:hypothetical protein n=1 Tax=Lacihabitans sp. CCS-44 TaxID=2487331 RepID=UPI0020CBBF4C|nr:hypothetical protein [Lacihabitans sp. CCS-44]
MSNENAKILKGLEDSYKKMVEFKKYKKSKIVEMRDGKIVHLDPFLAEPEVKYQKTEKE